MQDSPVEKEQISLQGTVDAGFHGERFDVIASHLFQQFSRSRLQQWIKAGDILVNGEQRKTRDKLIEGDELTLEVELLVEADEDQARDIPLDIVYEDDSILVLNKPAGLVVHPAAGHRNDTLMNGLLFHYPALANVPRAGIVHRLDKDTSGLMVVAKTLEAHHSLVAQLQERTVSRQYYALVQGVMTAGGTVDMNIGRHKTNRQKQSVLHVGGKEAITHYRVVKRYRANTLVRCKLETGRTHQIRVHMAHIRYPLIGDKLYGGRPKIPKASAAEVIESLQQFPRQALHAYCLGLQHPEDGEYCEWEIDLPDDLASLLSVLDTDLREHGNDYQG